MSSSNWWCWCCQCMSSVGLQLWSSQWVHNQYLYGFHKLANSYSPVPSHDSDYLEKLPNSLRWMPWQPTSTGNSHVFPPLPCFAHICLLMTLLTAFAQKTMSSMMKINFCSMNQIIISGCCTVCSKSKKANLFCNIISPVLHHLEYMSGWIPWLW